MVTEKEGGGIHLNSIFVCVNLRKIFAALKSRRGGGLALTDATCLHVTLCSSKIFDRVGRLGSVERGMKHRILVDVKSDYMIQLYENFFFIE